MNSLNMQADAQARKVTSKAVRKVVSSWPILWSCPRCDKWSSDFPAISRRNGSTEICSACGVNEALQDFVRSQK